jgi:hypothetical protein
VAAVLSECLLARREHSTLATSATANNGDTAATATAAAAATTATATVNPALPTPAQCLLHKCQQVAAHSAGLTLKALLALPSGSQKRSLLDDITIIVLWAHSESDSST